MPIERRQVRIWNNTRRHQSGGSISKICRPPKEVEESAAMRERIRDS
jgi:hypothetical protein